MFVIGSNIQLEAVEQKTVLGYRHIYFGSDKITLAISLGLLMRLGAHEFNSLVVMPAEDRIKNFAHKYFRHARIIYYNDIDLDNPQKEYFNEYDAVFFLSLKPDLLRKLLPFFSKLKSKEIIVTSRKYKEEFLDDFDYVNKIDSEQFNPSSRVTIITGEGKGKTTGSIGMALLERIRGRKSFIFHFCKNKGQKQEIEALKKIVDLEQLRLGHARPEYVWLKKGSPDPRDVKLAQDGLKLIEERVNIFGRASYVLDEIFLALNYDLITLKALQGLIESMPAESSLTLTGRGAVEDIKKLSGQVYTINKIKHPYDKKVPSRVGIEY